MIDRLINIVCPVCNKSTKYKDLLKSKRKPNWWDLVAKDKVCPKCQSELIMETNSVRKLNFILLFMAILSVAFLIIIQFKFIENNHYFMFIYPFFILISFGYFLFSFQSARWLQKTKDDKA